MSSLFKRDWHARQLRGTVATLVLLACTATHAQSVDPGLLTEGGFASRTALGGTPLRIGHRTEGFGQEASETNMGGRGAMDLGGAVGFVDGQFRISNVSRFGTNVGGGIRWFGDDYITGTPRLFGVSGWYDGQETLFNNYFNQGGVSFESLGEFIDFRMNANIPFEDQKISDEGTFLTGDLEFAGNSLVQTTLTPADVTLRVVDAEIAARVFDLNLWTYGGVYQMDGNNVSDTGAKIGFRGYLTNDLLVDVGVTQDDTFHTNTVAQVIWTPGRTGAGPTSWIHTLADRMREPVYRNTYIATQQTLIEGENLLTDVDGSALDIVHVDSTAAAGGDGTFENPYNTLAQVTAGTVAGDIILAHHDSVFSAQSVTLKDSQRFLGEGDRNGDGMREAHFITTNLGTFQIPATDAFADTGAIPQINNAVGSAIILAGATSGAETAPQIEVSVFQITGGTSAITSPTGVGDVFINRLDIADTTGDAINLTPLTETLAAGGTRSRFTPTIDDITFDNIGGDDIDLNATTAQTTIVEDIDISDIESDNGDGMGIRLTGLNRATTINNFNWDGGTTGLGALRIANSIAAGDVVMNGTNTITGGTTAAVDTSGFAIQLQDNAGDLTVSGTTVTNTGGDSVIVNGGAGALNFTGRIVKNTGTASILDVNAGVTTAVHTGTITFTELTNNAGVILATAGDGLQFNAADGVYTFNDEVEIRGDLANTATSAVNVTGDSDGAITFVNADFLDTDGTTIRFEGGDASMTLTGRVEQNSNFTTLSVEAGHNGTLTFNELTANTGVIEATNGEGLVFTNADGAYTFNDEVVLSGTAHIDVNTGSEGTFNFVDGDIDTTGTNVAVSITGSNAIFTYTGDIDSADADAVVLTGNTGGSVTFNSTIDSADEGILIQSNTAGTFLFADAITLNGSGNGIRILQNSGANVTFTDTITSDLEVLVNQNTAGTFAFNGQVTLTGTTNGVTIENNTGGTTSFANIDITKTGAGRGFFASSAAPGHIVTVTGGGNTIDTETGVALTLNNIAAGGAGINFQSVSSDGAASGIVITNVTGGPVNIGTAGAAQGASGTIANSTGSGVVITNAALVQMNGLTVDGAGADGVQVSHTNAAQSVVRINNAVITDTTGSGIDYSRSSSGTSRFTLMGSTINDNDDTSVLMAINGSGTQDITINQGNQITNTAADSALNITTGGGAKTTNILLDNNTFVSTSADPTVNLVSGSAGTMNTTVTSNNLTNAGAGTAYAQTSNQGTVRLDLNGNTATAVPAPFEYVLTENGGSNFTAVDVADIQTNNAGDTATPVQLNGTITDEPNPVPLPTP